MVAMKFWMLSYNVKEIDIKYAKNVKDCNMKIQFAKKFYTKSLRFLKNKDKELDFAQYVLHFSLKMTIVSM